MSKRPRPLKSQAQLEAEKLIQRANDLDAVNLPPDAAILERQHDIEITRQGQTRDGRKVEGEQARRLCAFSALKEGMAPGCFDATQRLERDVMIRYGHHDYGRPVQRVDCEQAAFNRNDLMLMAGERVDRVLGHVSDRERWLLLELIVPTVDKGGWRGTVFWITGAATLKKQADAVHAAAISLRDAYAKTERRAA